VREVEWAGWRRLESEEYGEEWLERAGLPWLNDTVEEEVLARS
jgi:hypothetical protein